MDGTERTPVHRNQTLLATVIAPFPRDAEQPCPCVSPLQVDDCLLYNWAAMSNDPTTAIYISGKWRSVGPCTLLSCQGENPCTREYPGAPIRPPLRTTASRGHPGAFKDPHGACVMRTEHGFRFLKELDHRNWPAPRPFNCPPRLPSHIEPGPAQ